MRLSMVESAEKVARSQAQTLATALDKGAASVLVEQCGTEVTGTHGSPASPPVVSVTAADGRTVVASVQTQPVEDAISTLWTVLVPAVPLLLLVVGLATWLAIGRALRPVEAIRAEVAEIADHDLNRRVPVPPSRDEIALLASTMNNTLDRLRAAVRQHHRFVADASHELRGPLSALRTQLELAAHGHGSWPQDAAAALQDTERLQWLADDLLFLARLGGVRTIGGEPVDLGQLAVEEVGKRGVGVQVDVQPDVVVPGSESHLARLLTNLVDNAERHADTVVRISVRPGVLEVHDDGPGVPPDQRDRIFEPFTRLDDARSPGLGGAGLGLAIARDIVAAQGGTLTVGDSPLGGAVFQAKFRVMPT